MTQPSDDATFLRPEDVARQVTALRSLTERLDGPYALVAISPDGSGTIVSDPFGLHPLYHRQFGSSCVVSNDAALVAAVVERVQGIGPESDEDAVAWLLLNGQMFGDATPYRGVARLPFGSGAVLRSDGEMTVVPWHEPPWHRIDAPAAARHETVDAAEQRMIATILAALAATPGAVISELTAGRDSRLVMQLTARAGVADRVLFRTYGPRNSPDRTVAAEISAPARAAVRHWKLAFVPRPTNARDIGRAGSAGLCPDLLLGVERAGQTRRHHLLRPHWREPENELSARRRCDDGGRG